jgi:hypothetical protein
MCVRVSLWGSNPEKDLQALLNEKHPNSHKQLLLATSTALVLGRCFCGNSERAHTDKSKIVVLVCLAFSFPFLTVIRGMSLHPSLALPRELSRIPSCLSSSAVVSLTPSPR